MTVCGVFLIEFLVHLSCASCHICLRHTFGSLLISGIRNVARVAMLCFCCSARKLGSDEAEDNVIEGKAFDWKPRCDIQDCKLLEAIEVLTSLWTYNNARSFSKIFPRAMYCSPRLPPACLASRGGANILRLSLASTYRSRRLAIQTSIHYAVWCLLCRCD